MTNSINPYKGDPAFIEKLRKMHPFKLFMYIAILSIGILFFFLIVGFLLTNDASKFYLPKHFTFSTLVLLISSFYMYKSVQNYADDNIKMLLQNLVICFLLGQLFIYSQFKGWGELQQKGLFLSGNVNGSYLYLLSGLHVLHFVGGMIFLIVIFSKVYTCNRDEVKRLLYVTSPMDKMKLQLLHTYWQFMDIVWLVLFFVFIIPDLF
ncbi:MAG: cytochrome c oxidase subunit 3 [Bacteroidota bacterium]|nr:cytochrome c oxidase subunit 3 [Bacteroidota bacterium]